MLKKGSERVELNHLRTCRSVGWSAFCIHARAWISLRFRYLQAKGFFLASVLLHKGSELGSDWETWKRGNNHLQTLPQKKEGKEERGRVRGNEVGGVREVTEEAVIVFFLLSQSVSSYVLLPSLLIFIPKMLRQEYKAGSAGSDDFGQISLLLLLTGSKYPSSHSGRGLNRLLPHLLFTLRLRLTLYVQTKGWLIKL